MTKTMGQVAFEAYNESKGGLTYDGKPIPPWESLTDEKGLAVRAGWEAAAKAVVDGITIDPGTAILHAYASVRVNTKPSREQSCVLTKLDEARLWLDEARRSTPVVG